MAAVSPIAGDLGAGLAGRKVTIFSPRPDRLSDLLLSRVKQRIGNEDPHFAKGITYMEPFKQIVLKGKDGSPVPRTDPGIKNTILVGPEQKVRRLAKLLEMMWRMMAQDVFDMPWELEREIGQLLGYPPESAMKYLNQLLFTDNQKRRSELRAANLGNDTIDDVRGFGREMGRVSQSAQDRGVTFPSPEEVDRMNSSEIANRMRQR